MRRLWSTFLIAGVVTALLSLPAIASSSSASVPEPTLRAGASVVDATWHVGASAGQYSGFRSPHEELHGDVDPHGHHVAKEASYGVHSRLTIRALVVEGSNGQRVALVKSDNYLAQDHLLRRVGQLLDSGDSGVGYSDILHAASHNHSSPYYATPSWGVWLFQDVVDLRMFEYQARAMARAIEEAAADLAPARMGATTVNHDVYKGNITRPQTADDGSPAGFPADYGDHDLTVLRFDRWAPDTDEGWAPLAAWMNYGQHPESLDSYDLITADFLAPLERFFERDTGAQLLFSQGDVGSAEGPYDGWNRGRLEDDTLVAWAHVGHAQTERGARLLADAVIEGYEAIGRGEGRVPFRSDLEVGVVDGWVPGPVSHPHPSVSNCRTATTVEGDPGLPVAGLPDCARGGFGAPFNPAYENVKAHGIPIPDHYGAPGFAAVQENLRLRLQVVKLGDVVLGSCACEAQVDLVRNFKSRANDVAGDIHDGFDWTEEPRTTCEQDAAIWTCLHRSPHDRERVWTFGDDAYRRMIAQIHNDAAGWDDVGNALTANTEPDDPDEILGNFTKEELPPDLGYPLVVGVGHAGDYNGYTVSYREYQSYDHYRKALTSHGPHTADYMVTRLVRMAGELNGGPPYEGEPLDALAAVDELRQEATSQALGRAAGIAYEAWMAALPDDAGPVEAVEQPEDLRRFDAATFRWRGGSNAVDNPLVRVERRTAEGWRPFADMTGEVQTTVTFPQGVEGLVETHTGSQEWLWTAGFEAFTAGPDPRLGSTPAGTYRFVVDGNHRAGRATQPYTLTSEPFRVAPWDGITVTDLRVDGDEVSFQVGDTVGEGLATRYGVGDRYDVEYPVSYEGAAFPFVSDDGRATVCRTCSFRPWAFGGTIEHAEVTLRRPDGTTRTVSAVRDGDRWVASGAGLRPNDEVFVAAGGIRDQAGNTNGSASDAVTVTPPGGSKEKKAKGGGGSPSTAGAPTSDLAASGVSADDDRDLRALPIGSTSPIPLTVAAVLALALAASATVAALRLRDG
jgi:hypothetical protein